MYQLWSASCCLVLYLTKVCRLVHAASSWSSLAQSLLPIEGEQLEKSSNTAVLQQQLGEQDADSLNGYEDYVPLVAKVDQSTSNGSNNGGSSSGNNGGSSSGNNGGNNGDSMSELVAAAANWNVPSTAAYPSSDRVQQRARNHKTVTEHTLSPVAVLPQLLEDAALKAAVAPAGLGVKKVLIETPLKVVAAASEDDAADLVSHTCGSITPHLQRSHVYQHTPASAASAARVGSRSSSVSWAPQTPGSGAVR